MHKKMKNVCWVDVETTGLDPWRHDPTQLSYIIETEGEERVKRNLFMRPIHTHTCSSCKKIFRFEEGLTVGITCHKCENGVVTNNVEAGALKVTGKTLEEIMAYPDPEEALETLREDVAPILAKKERLVCGGYNIKSFDMPFMEKWLYKMTKGQTKFFQYFYYSPYLDVYPLVIALYYRVMIRTPENLPAEMNNVKLASAFEFARTMQPEYFEDLGYDEENANYHDALFDVQQTIDIFKSLMGV